MKTKKKKSIFTLVLVLMSMICLTGDPASPRKVSTVDTYSLSMRLRIPRIYDNMQSLGYRRYQSQWLKGQLNLVYRSDGQVDAVVYGLTNRTHRINGKNITYVCHPDDEHQNLVVAVGSNRTMKFGQGGIDIAFIADPSYNIGGVEEDNTLMLRLVGMGSITSDRLRTLRGSATGRIGCGCHVYGHISPTRIWHSFLTEIVVDVAPMYGSFTARFTGRTYVEENE